MTEEIAKMRIARHERRTDMKDLLFIVTKEYKRCILGKYLVQSLRDRRREESRRRALA